MMLRSVSVPYSSDTIVSAGTHANRIVVADLFSSLSIRRPCTRRFAGPTGHDAQRITNVRFLVRFFMVWRRRLLASTRGKILALLRADSHTVNELAEALELIDNTVRSHLTSLERDGLSGS